MTANFTIHRPDPAVAVPVVIHVPHAATWIPDHCRGDFALAGDELQAVIDAMVDRDTDTVGLEALEFGAHVFVNNVCRLVVDPERFRDDHREEAAARGMGAVYVNAHDGRRLRRADWTAADRRARIDEYYFPYHLALTALVAELQERFRRRVHILDLHSFPHMPHPYELDTGPRPAFCLGYDDAHAPRRWLRWWDELADSRLANSEGLPRDQLLAHNRPFAGSFVPRGMSGDHRVRSLMLEINRGLLASHGKGGLPLEVASFGKSRRVREFMEFICKDAREAVAEGGVISARAARAIIDDYLRHEHADAVAGGSRIESLYRTERHKLSLGAMLRGDRENPVIHGPMWCAQIAPDDGVIFYDGSTWNVLIDGRTGELVVSEVT